MSKSTSLLNKSPKEALDTSFLFETLQQVFKYKIKLVENLN